MRTVSQMKPKTECPPDCHPSREEVLDHPAPFAIEAGMTEQNPKKPAKPQTAKEAKAARMKAALRANLQRRKGQKRARTASEKD